MVHLTDYYSQEVPQPLVKRIAILMPSPDILVDPTSISKRERMPKPVEVSTTRREDTPGPSRPSEDTELEPVDADTSRMSPERRRTDIDPELKPPRKSRHEQCW